MAPLVSLLALFALALATTALASPHISRDVHNHARRAHIDVRADAPPLARRRRSLNKRCISRPNTTTSALPSSTVPINVAPLPSLPSSALPSPSSSPPPPPSYASPSPTPTPTPSPSTSSPSSPASTPSSSSSSGEPSYMIGTQSGQGTYYSTGLGACGITNNDGQNIAAVSQLLFDTYPGYNGINPNTNPVCGKTITASYQGKSVTVTVTDRCEACAITDLDFSPNAFDTLADPSVGRINLTWNWD